MEAGNLNGNDISSAKELCNLISERHHKYELMQLSAIKIHLGSAIKIDAEKFPAIRASWEIFMQLKDVLVNHLKKEEHLLFPFAEKTFCEGIKKSGSLLENPVKVLKSEHKEILELFSMLRRASHDYKPGPGCSPTGKLSMLEMEELEIDVKKSFELEERLLFTQLLKDTKS